MSKSREYIENLFSDVAVFEKEVLHVSSDPDRQDVVQMISKDICNEGDIASKISFLKIKSIDELDFSKVNIVFVQIILEEVFAVLHENRCSKVEINSVKNDKEKLKFIYALVKNYMRRFNSVLYKEVVNTFFELVSVAHRTESLSKVVNEVVCGSVKHKSLIEHHDGGQILYKPEQAWIRVKQARDDKMRKVQVHQVEIMSILKRVDYIKLHISAIVAANALSLNEVKNVTPNLLLDMFTDEKNIHLHTKKTMFSYVSSGEQANILSRTAHAAKNQSKDPHTQHDYQEIADFFTKCNAKNSKGHLRARLENLKNELEVKNDQYRRERLEMKAIRDRPLDSFDATLSRIKESMIYNLQRF